jgi:hypothetical protein
MASTQLRLRFAPASTTEQYFAALENAERRALHSYFDQHILEDDERGYIAVDEGDYNALPTHLMARVVHTIHGALLDEC